MRADRSLIPGVGAAVCLVAAVACAFFVTAALVAFHRWPQVTATSSARALVVAKDSARARPIVVAPAPSHAVHPVARVTPPASRAQAPLVAQVVSSSPRPRRILAVDTTGPATPAPVDQRPKTPSTATPKAPPPDTLAATTQTTATNVSGVVNGVTNGLANAVTPVSPALAGTVQQLGTNVSGAVVSIGDSLAQLLLGLSPSQ
jgi:hypothetical protein